MLIHKKLSAEHPRAPVPQNASESGTILPWLALCIALIASILFALTRTIRESKDEYLKLERKLHAEMQYIFTDAIELNAIANQNILMVKKLELALERTQEKITHAFEIAHTAQLWEQQLPIPNPYDVFEALNLSLAPLFSEISTIHAIQKEHTQKLSTFSSDLIIQLNVLQSLCSLRCLKSSPVLNKANSCSPSQISQIHCELTLNSTDKIFLPPKIALESILDRRSAQLPGLMFVDLEKLAKTADVNSSEHASNHLEKRLIPKVGLVHPRLCAQDVQNNFHLHCPPRMTFKNSVQNTHYFPAIEPHWSVAVELH